jgi:hypothetical protein
MTRRWMAHAAAVCAFAACGAAFARDVALSPAAEQLRQAYPGVRFHEDQGRIRIIYAVPMTVGASPEQAANQWIAQHGQAFGAGPLTVAPVESTIVQNGRFTALNYRQFIEGLPVEYGNLSILVLNQPIPRVVYAGATLAARPAGGFADATVTGEQALASVRRLPQYADLSVWTVPTAVIYQGETDWWPTPVRAWKFMGQTPGIATNRQFTFFVDVATGLLVQARNEVSETDVTGTVKGMATPGLQADHSGNPPTLQPIPDILMTVQGGNTAYSARNGDFTIPNAGTAQVTITSNASAGRWVDVNPQGGVSEVSVNVPNTPGTPAAPIFNPTPSGANSTATAQVNAMIHVDMIHNYYKDRAPGFTGIDVKIPANTGVSGTCNAFFNTTPSVNFYNVGGGCNNTAFSTVIAHEYGHFVVNRRGLSQGSFGEGFGDTSSVLLYDTGLLGEYFFTNGGVVRNLITTTQVYPCSGEIHTCGEVLAAFWYRARQNFGTKYGSGPGLDKIRDLQVAWAMVTTGGSGNNAAQPSTAIEVLTVDDDDGNLANGTPNYNEICASFALRNIQCPQLSLLTFSYPNGRPDVMISGQPTTIRVDVSANAASPSPGTGTVSYKFNSGAYTTIPMNQIAPNQYEAVIPGANCLDTISYYFAAQSLPSGSATDPQGAPATAFGAISGAAVITPANFNFETDPGWTVTNDSSLTTGAWERGVPHTPPSTNCPPADADGSGKCWVTDNRSGNFDVDGGPTVLTTPNYDLSAAFAAKLSYARWFKSTGARNLVIQMSNNGGLTWTTIETVSNTASGWVTKEWSLSSIMPVSIQTRFRFSVSDNPDQFVTEAAIDAFKITGVSCTAPCYADCNGDGVLGLADFGCFQSKFATNDPYADCNGDGILGLADFGCFQSKFALGCP